MTCLHKNLCARSWWKFFLFNGHKGWYMPFNLGHQGKNFQNFCWTFHMEILHNTMRKLEEKENYYVRLFKEIEQEPVRTFMPVDHAVSNSDIIEIMQRAGGLGIVIKHIMKGC